MFLINVPKELIKKIWYIYTMEYYSAIKNNNMRNFASINGWS